jgi:hypothetical protein
LFILTDSFGLVLLGVARWSLLEFLKLALFVLGLVGSGTLLSILRLVLLSFAFVWFGLFKFTFLLSNELLELLLVLFGFVILLSSILMLKIVSCSLLTRLPLRSAILPLY